MWGGQRRQPYQACGVPCSDSIDKAVHSCSRLTAEGGQNACPPSALLIKLLHRRHVFDAGEVDCIWQEHRVRSWVALQSIEQEGSGEVMNQL
jgi:hypothetical protein